MRGQCERCTRGDHVDVDAQFACRLSDWNVRAPERPAATQRHIDTQAKTARFLSGVSQCGHMPLGKKRHVVEATLRIVERKGIKIRNLYAADSRRLHLFQFAGNLGIRGCRPKPPPAHHDSAGIRRIGEAAVQF